MNNAGEDSALLTLPLHFGPMTVITFLLLVLAPYYAFYNANQLHIGQHHHVYLLNGLPFS